MNKKIEKAFADFTVNGKTVPVKFLQYMGKSDTYVVYYESDSQGALYGDDSLLNYVSYYDFSIYTKGNYKSIVEAIKSIMLGLGFTWCMSRDSADLYEADTGYYHKVICFAIERSEEKNG